jgi:3',5'-cyclic AMP phosphodiesterase CpdA
MTQLGQHPQPQWRIAHLSDTHFLAGGAKLGGVADTVATLTRALAQLERFGGPLDAIVITGDLTDLGEADAYQRLKALVVPAAQRLGARLCWVTGNHDDRATERVELLSEVSADTPICKAWQLGDLRIIAIDSTVPGHHHGEISAPQLEWLREKLAIPSPAGTLLALHHAPIPSPVALMDVLELQNQDELAAVLEGSDVRAILGGHLHYPTTTVFHGIPVFVAGALSYTIDVSAPRRDLYGISGGQSMSLIEVHPGQIVSSVIPVGDFEQVSHIPEAYLAQLELLDRDARLAAFSRFGGTLPAPE